MDRSKYYSTVHGERSPDDPSRNVHFYQDGLPFDAHGILVPELVKSPEHKALVDRKMKKLAAAMKAADTSADEDKSADDADEGDSANVSTASTADDVNLEAWLRGEAKYHFFAIREAIRKRFSHNIKDQRNAIEILVLDEKIVSEDELAPAFRALLNLQG